MGRNLPVVVDRGPARERSVAAVSAAASLARERLTIVVGGHVDHGKSTIIGRLLADTGSLPEGKLQQVQALCQRTAKPFEHAFLIDALKEEQAQGITIAAARIFFKTETRDYLVIDAPGHVEFLKNLVTGAGRAEAALLVIDASEGIRENSRRHGYMMSMLGIRQLAVVVNKMDLVGYDATRFRRIEAEYRAFLAPLRVHPTCVIPVSARSGENVATPSFAMRWYDGPTVIEALDAFAPAAAAVDKPFRMPVQDVYKFTANDDDRRIVAGTVETGAAAVGDEVVFYPSGRKALVRSFEAFNQPPPDCVSAGHAVGFTLSDQIYVSRGEVATLSRERPPNVTTRLRVSLFWLGHAPLVTNADYLFRIGTARVTMRLLEVHRVIDASDLSTDEQKQRVDRHEVAECTLALNRAVAVDRAVDIAPTARFVIIDDFQICGGGIVQDALPDEQAGLRRKILLRNYKWEPSVIPRARRSARFGQRPALVLITGPGRGVERKALARALEASLFESGRAVYFLGIGNVLYGVDADIARDREHRQEHIRRLAEIANLMLDAGTILIVTAMALTQEDLEVINAAVGPDAIQTVWVGDTSTTGISCHLSLSEHESETSGVDRITRLLQDQGIIIRP